MHFSRPSLHAAVVGAPDQRKAVEALVASLVGKQLFTPPHGGAGASGDSITIPLTTVSLQSNFDAYISVWFQGASPTSAVQTIFDSGNSTLIVPNWEDIDALPNGKADYQVLGVSTEPWGCPANIVRGPIKMSTTSGESYTIQNCVFYACTAPNSDGERTANFGSGCVSPWSTDQGITMQSPLSYNSSYPYAGVNYASASDILSATSAPLVASNSFLTLYKVAPADYAFFEILPDLEWMALTPKSLSIGGTKTLWPGSAPSPIAMIDTGGGPVFLSDPNGYVCNSQWPDQVDNPSWTNTSEICQSTCDDIALEIGDGSHAFSYKIDPSHFPSPAQGMTLVMCKKNYYMMGQQGLNIGGISVLVNYLFIDYRNFRVGLKPK
jgi:hypothetical protein